MRIRTRGFKGQDLDLDLGKLSILVGPNGSGKTTAADALRFAALGYIPALGGRLADTAAIMREREAAVEIEFSPARALERTIAAGGGKGHSGSVECSWLRNAKPAEHAAEILRLFGREELDVAEVLDIRELLRATPSKRAERIEQMLSASGSSPKEKAQRVAELTVRRLADKVDDELADWRKLIDILPAGLVGGLRALSGMLEAKIQDGGVAAALTWANAQKRDGAALLRQKTQAKAELEGRIAEIPPSLESDLSTLRSDHDRLQRDLGAARERVERARTAAENLEKAAAAVKQAAGLEETAQGERRKVEEALRVLPKLEASRKGNVGSLAAIQNPADPDFAEATAMERRAADLEKQAEAFVLETVPDVSGIEQDVRRVNAHLEALERSDWNQVLVVAVQIEGMADGAKKWLAVGQRLRTLAEKGMGANPAELQANLEAAEKRLATAKAAAEKVEKKNAAVEANKTACEYAAEAARRDGAEIRRQQAQAYERAYAKAVEGRKTLQREGEDLSRRIEEIRRADRDSAAALMWAEADLASARNRLEALGGEAAAGVSSQEHLGEIGDQIDRATAKIRELEGAAAARAELTRLVKDIEAAEAQAEIAKALEWALLRAREEEVTQAGGPLIERLTRFLRGAGRQETPFLRAEKGTSAIGWRTPAGDEVLVQVLSGAEWCLFTAALAAAVMAIRGAELRVLLVEAEAASRETLGQILAGISAVAGDLTHAVVMTPHEEYVNGGAGEGWTVTVLGNGAH